MIPFINLKSQYVSVKKDIDSAIEGVFKSGKFILGDKVEEFEKAFASYCGARYGIGVASGTEALYLALISAGVERGDEVITAPNTTAPTVAAVYMAGAIPVFADIDKDTLNINADKLKRAVTRRTKAIIPVHLYGNPVDMDPVMKTVRSKGLKVIEDACQAHGASYKGKKTGSIGDMGCFSFYPTKNLGCYGDGGMVVTNDKKLAGRLKRIRVYGEVKRYKYLERGINSRLDELQAAILLKKLPRLEEWNKKRIKLAKIYDRGLNGLPLETPSATRGARHIYHLYVIKAERRTALSEYLASKGIQTIVHYPDPLYDVKPYAGRNNKKDFPVCEEMSNKILSLPIYPELRAEDAGYVTECIRKFYKGGKR